MDEAKQKSFFSFKKWPWFFLIIFLVIWAILRFYDFYWPSATVRFPAGQEIKVLLADRPSHWQRGLSGRSDLGEYGGMLFIFGEKSRHTMVMREMKFPLDIVWLDSGMVVDIAPGLQPEPGKSEAGLTRYAPRLPATAVLELPAGSVARYGLKIGDRVEFLDK